MLLFLFYFILLLRSYIVFRLCFRFAIALVEYLNTKVFNIAFFVVVIVVVFRSFVCLFVCGFQLFSVKRARVCFSTYCDCLTTWPCFEVKQKPIGTCSRVFTRA